MILERLVAETGVSTSDLLKIIRTAHHRYKTYRIPKRTGGFRVIHHPTPTLKFLQRWLNRNIFESLSVHEAAVAYRRGIGISDNAKRHVRNTYLLKVDFQDFFPSLSDDDVKYVLTEQLLDKNPLVSEDDIKLIVHIVCRKSALTIGAPSSPILSNAILYDFDFFLSGVCREEGIVYSRYADDLFLSTNKPNVLSEVLKVIRTDLRERTRPRLTVNNAKTVFTSKKRKRVAAGLILTSDDRLSIGRDKKRQIRTLVYLYSTNKLPPEKISYLHGYLAFASSVEPEFVGRLRQKYGNEIINRLLGA